MNSFVQNSITSNYNFNAVGEYFYGNTLSNLICNITGYDMKTNIFKNTMFDVNCYSFLSNTFETTNIVFNCNCLSFSGNSLKRISFADIRANRIKSNTFSDLKFFHGFNYEFQGNNFSNTISNFIASGSSFADNTFESAVYDLLINQSIFTKNSFSNTTGHLNYKITANWVASNKFNNISSLNLEARDHLHVNNFNTLTKLKINCENLLTSEFYISNNVFESIDRLYFTDASIDKPKNNTFNSIGTLYLRHRIPDFTSFTNSFNNISFVDFDKVYDSSYLDSVLPEDLKTCRFLVNGIDYWRLFNSETTAPSQGVWEQLLVDYIYDSHDVKASYNSLNVLLNGDFLITRGARATISTVDYLTLLLNPLITLTYADYEYKAYFSSVGNLFMDMRPLQYKNTTYNGVSFYSVDKMSLLFAQNGTDSACTFNFFPTNGIVNSLTVYCANDYNNQNSDKDFQFFGNSAGFTYGDFKFKYVDFMSTYSHSLSTWNNFYQSPYYLIKRAEINSVRIRPYFALAYAPFAACLIDKVMLDTDGYTIYNRRSNSSTMKMFANCSKVNPNTPLFYFMVNDESEWLASSNNWTTVWFSNLSSEFDNFNPLSPLFSSVLKI